MQGGLKNGQEKKKEQSIAAAMNVTLAGSDLLTKSKERIGQFD